MRLPRPTSRLRGSNRAADPGGKRPPETSGTRLQTATLIGRRKPADPRLCPAGATGIGCYQTACLVMLLDLVAETGMPSLLGLPFFGVLSNTLVGRPIFP